MVRPLEIQFLISLNYVINFESCDAMVIGCTRVRVHLLRCIVTYLAMKLDQLIQSLAMFLGNRFHDMEDWIQVLSNLPTYCT